MPSRFRVRPATPDDKRASFDVFIPAVRELSARLGAPWDPDPDEVWRNQTAFLDFLAAQAAEWWVAEDDASGRVIGYARSLERGGLFELSEFFVLPDNQSGGVGRALLDKAFPEGRGEVRVIIATTDVRAQARYYRAGTVARFPIAGVTAKPGVAVGQVLSDGVEPARATPDDIADLSALERSVLEFDRGDEFGWLIANREGYLYRHGGEVVGSAFLGQRGAIGPVAASHPDHLPAILDHLERRAAELEIEEVALEVPMVNEVAMRHLLGRGFRMDTFLTLLMSNRPFGRFDRFLGLSPPFVL
ncbi:MAG TPA: GNAT family N-acetyltransferase [Candidatus Limnocylindria bacterium]|nr:GNAT family N-acetyltransferase [Candidatus Limnocylindria bacterium]